MFLLAGRLKVPYIKVELFEGRSSDQKQEFVEVITRETARILKCDISDVDIIFTDIKKENWALGGKIQKPNRDQVNS